MSNNITRSLIDASTGVLIEKSGDKEEYRKFFNSALKKFGVKSPAELKGDKEKEFYNYVDKNWKSDKEESTKDEELEKDKDDPCWDGYVQLGTKKKDGKEVPNCVPKEEANLDESIAEVDDGDYGVEAASEMKETQLHFIKYAAQEILDCIETGCVMPEWYQNKLAKVEGEMEGLHSYMEGQKRKMMQPESGMTMSPGMYGEETEINEKSTSQKQQKLMGMAYALKKGEMDAEDASDEVKRLADTMSLSDLKDFASTKHDDLPVKVEELELMDDPVEIMEKFSFKGDKIRNPFKDFNGALVALTGLAIAATAIASGLASIVFFKGVAKIIVLMGFGGVLLSWSGVAGFNLWDVFERIKDLISSRQITSDDTDKMNKIANDIKNKIGNDPKLKGHKGAITRLQNELAADMAAGDKKRVLFRMRELRGKLASLDNDSYMKSVDESIRFKGWDALDLAEIGQALEDNSESSTYRANYPVIKALKNGELPSKREIDSMDSLGSEMLMMMLSELLGYEEVEKLYNINLMDYL